VINREVLASQGLDSTLGIVGMHLPVPQFPCLSTGVFTHQLHEIVVKIKWNTTCKVLLQMNLDEVPGT
jgi:hypothetical protein